MDVKEQKPIHVGDNDVWVDPATGLVYLAKDKRGGGLNMMVDRTGHQVRGCYKSE